MNRGRLGGVRHVLTKVNVRACVAETHVPVDLRLHHRRYKEMKDGDPTCEIWTWVRMDSKDLSLALEHDGKGPGQ